jgi:hypothetical protein
MGIRCSQRERPATAVNTLSLSTNKDPFRVEILALTLNARKWLALKIYRRRLGNQYDLKSRVF